ncbi:unnamed protein product [Urochloa decumbens]|uniref:Uncharacterized protein n=1 Tax=Urochloa decumbens TaxID=240449 RepID=A0ABC8WZ66_9POAL
MICICCPPKADGAAEAGQRAISIRQNAQDLPRPEWKITLFVFLEMFLPSATSSVATVGVVWATVVLLGGFVSKLNILDFWLVIAVTLIQSMRIFGGDWNPDQKILYGLLDKNIIDRLGHRRTLTMWKASVFLRCIRSCPAERHGASCHPGYVNTHLVYPGFGDTGQSTEDINQKTSIIIFYGVAIAQALMSYLVFAYSQARSELLCMVYNCEDYRFVDKDLEAMRLYYIHVRKICRDGRISAALDMNLATFAIQCLKSNERDVNHSGIRLLNNLTQEVVAEQFRTEAITKLGDSHDAVESLFRLVASTSPEEKRERKMAALLIAKLPDSFHISGFLFAMRSVCSLLEATTDGASGMVEVDEVLVRVGLKILDKFSGHVCNMPDISDSHELTAKITRFTSHIIEISQPIDANHIDFMKAKCSLSVLGKLTGATGKRGRVLRQDILQNILLLSSIREMVQNPSISFVLRELAILVIDGFALGPETRNCGATRKMAMELISIFCSSPHEANDEDQIKFQLAAGRAVTRLTTESMSNCDAIIMAEDGNLHALRGMISSQPNTLHLVVAANVLRNLCEHLTLTADTKRQDTIRRSGQENMATAYLSLALQLSRAIPEEEFSDALNGVGCERFVQKLNSVVNEANARAADRSPGIRRSAIEMAIWMMRPGGDQLTRTQHFVDCGMRSTLMAVKATREESYKLLSAGGVPVLEHEESLSALVKSALRLIPEAPNGQ